MVLADKGLIDTFTIVHVGFGHMADKAPYVLAIVELGDNTKLTAILEDVSDFKTIKIGTKVSLKRIDEKIGYVFTPAE